jgi:hypothetical protein
MRRQLDKFAVLLSGACVIHCALIPVVLIVMPAFGGHLLEAETTTHWLLLGVAAPVSVVALGAGYKRHGHGATIWLGLAGLLVMFLGVSHLFGRAFEVPVTLLGVAMIAIVHLLNVRRSRLG